MNFILLSRGIPEGAFNKLNSFTGKEPKHTKVCYITTPANIYPSDSPWLVEVLDQFKSRNYHIETFDLEDAFKNNLDIGSYINQFDVVFVSGGNVFYFMYWVEKTNFANILKNFLENSNKVYMGGSSGAMCQIKDLTPIETLDDPTKAPERINEGMKLTDVIVIPHWGREKYQSRLEEVKVYYERSSTKVYTLEDGQAVVVSDDLISLI